MNPTLGAVAIASLVGSLHCAGMCGPLSAVASASPKPIRQHSLYAAGRLIGYLLLGAVAGALGGLVETTGAMLGFQRALTAIAGTSLIVGGVVVLLKRQGSLFGSGGSRLAAKILARLVEAPPWIRGLGLGVVTAALPCGWLWAFVVAAAAAGTALGGAAVMAAFWVGAVPALAILGLGGGGLLRGLGRHAPRLAALALIAVGLLTVWRGVPAWQADADAETPVSCHCADDE